MYPTSIVPPLKRQLNAFSGCPRITFLASSAEYYSAMPSNTDSRMILFVPCEVAIEALLEALAKAELVDKFETTLWCGLVDYVTVHSKDDVWFTFKNGQEIRA